MEKLKEHIGLIIAGIFAFFDGTIGIIELIIFIILSYIITKIFKRKIAESIASINGYSDIGNLVNNYLVKDEETNDIISSVISIFTDSLKRKKQKEFNKKMKIWINVTEVSLFIIIIVISVTFDI